MRFEAKARKAWQGLYQASSGLPRTFGPKAAITTMTTIIADVIRPNTPRTPASRSSKSI